MRAELSSWPFVAGLGLAVAVLVAPARAGLAPADFNGDGWGDLAVAESSKDAYTPKRVPDVGAVTVFYGSPTGIVKTGSQFLRRGLEPVGGKVGDFEYFGGSLAAGDFDGDGHTDLAMGAPGADAPGHGGAGEVVVLYGSAKGLGSARRQTWNQDSPGIDDAADGVDRFGHALAAGDLDDDGFADLAIGAPQEQVVTQDGVRVGAAGVVHVLYGSSLGLSAARSQVLIEPGGPRWLGNFGSALSVGALGDGPLEVGEPGGLDLVVGAHGTAESDPDIEGQVHVYFTRAGQGVDAQEVVSLRHDTPGVLGNTSPGTYFGSTLLAGAQGCIYVTDPEEIIGAKRDGFFHRICLAPNGAVASDTAFARKESFLNGFPHCFAELVGADGKVTDVFGGQAGDGKDHRGAVHRFKPNGTRVGSIVGNAARDWMGQSCAVNVLDETRRLLIVGAEGPKYFGEIRIFSLPSLSRLGVIAQATQGVRKAYYGDGFGTRAIAASVVVADP